MAEQRQQSQPPQGNGGGGGQQQVPYKGSNKLTVEIVNYRLGPVMFNPLKIRLRARFSKGKMTRDEHVEVTGLLPDNIPGQCISIDIAARQGLIFDPLEKTEYREMLAQISRANKAGGPLGTEASYFPQTVHENLSDIDVKTWLYEIRKLLDHPTWLTVGWRDNPPIRVGGPLAIVIQGDIPSRQEVEQIPGPMRINHFSNSHTLPREKLPPPKVAS